MTERTLSQAPDTAGLDDTGPAQDFIVLAQAEGAGDGATSLPRDLVQLDEEIEEAAQEQAAIDRLAVTEIDVAPLAAGERRFVDVAPNSVVSLAAAPFDPSSATYAVSANDLVVTLANGGVLVLVGFFAPSEAPPLLRVLDGPATPAPELLERAEAAPTVASNQADGTTGGEEYIEPTAGPVSGGAEFRAYDQGDIGDGLDPLGPLGPTSLAFGAPVLIPTPVDDGTGDNNNGGDGPPPPVDSGPTVELRANIEASIGEQSEPAFNPATTPVLPPIVVGQDVPANQVNNVDQRNLTLDVDREVVVRFIFENSFSIDSLFVHEIGPNGEFENVQLVFEGVNKPGDPLSNLLVTPLGTEFSLGTYEAGTQLGFVLVNDGLRLNDFDSLEGGRYEVFSRLTGEPATIFDSHNPAKPWQQPSVVYVADDGTVTPIIGSRTYFTADGTPESPDFNQLNPTDQAQFISGWNDTEGFLEIAAEDTFGPDGNRDFAALQFGVRFLSTIEPSLVVNDAAAGLGAVITDPDSTEMQAAAITLDGLAGDRLVLDPAVLDGTGITATQVSDSEIKLDGLSSIANYEAAINATAIAVDLENVQFGDREISVVVEDPEGNTGDSSTVFTLEDKLVVGTDGPDTIIGTDTPTGQLGDVISALAGDDNIDSLSGDDFVDAGDGDDTLTTSGNGLNTFIGSTGVDQITLNPGADRLLITGLGDGADTILNFNATEGDRLDLTELFRDSDITDATIASFVSNSAYADGIEVQADLDGPGTHQRPVTIAFLEQPTGVAVGADPSTYVITPDNDAAAA